jgi:hypothetical protein
LRGCREASIEPVGVKRNEELIFDRTSKCMGLIGCELENVLLAGDTLKPSNIFSLSQAKAFGLVFAEHLQKDLCFVCIQPDSLLSSVPSQRPLPPPINHVTMASFTCQCPTTTLHPIYLQQQTEDAFHFAHLPHHMRRRVTPTRQCLPNSPSPPRRSPISPHTTAPSTP